ncbi:MAG: hypothetical protein KDD65_19070 [Bacteroidetes bacterium]|nr:hypothetical protein [Bacteroidota bacterium]
MTWVWVLIPLAAIIVGGITEIVKQQNKRADRLGQSNDELSQSLSTLRSQLDRMEENQEAYQRRLQNLEAIVTNQVWDIVHEPSQSAEEKRANIAGSGLLDSAAGYESESDARRAEQLAKRLR